MRLGRGQPRRAIIIRSQAGKVASGTVATHGGGAVANTGRKNASGSARTSGGGRIVGAGFKHAAGTASTNGGGHVLTEVLIALAGVSVTSGGGRVTNTGRKNASGSARTSGGGSTSGSARKGGLGHPIVSGGGHSTATGGGKTVSGAATTTGGGHVVSMGRNGGAPEVDLSLRPSPDLTGFQAAMRYKRRDDVLGESITFLWPPVEVWPLGTILDPDTGRPYDPVLEPDSSVRASATLPGSVAFRAINRAGIGGEAGGEAPGWLDKSHAMVILNSGYASAVEDADSFLSRGSEYEIRTTKFDGVTDIDRFLVYGARERDA